MNVEMWFLVGICITLLVLIGLMVYVRGRLLKIANRLKTIADRINPKRRGE